MMTKQGAHDRPNRVSRRRFVASAVGGAAALGSSPGLDAVTRTRGQGANDDVGVGFVGLGIRGEILLRATQAIGGARPVRVCDLYDGHFDRARELAGSGLATGKDYREVLDDKNVQAVVVAVPDHWHRSIALDALAAGKDVYLEKPMTHRWEDGPVIASAAGKGRRILQVGSQYQSMPANERAAEIIRSGRLGTITLISGSIHRNTATGAWYYPVAPDASPSTIDWKRFIGSAPWHDFDARRFFQWRLFWDYSGGLPTDLFVHLVTAVHSIVDVEMPSRVVAIGGTYRWKDREVPDQMTAIAEYPEGFSLTLTSTANNNHAFAPLTFMGTEGTLEYYGTRLVLHAEPPLENYTYSTNHLPAATRRRFAQMNDLDPTSMRPKATASMKPAPPETIATPGPDATEAHLRKFFESVRTRREPVENATMGSRCATVGHMVNLSYKSRSEARWNSAQQSVLV